MKKRNAKYYLAAAVSLITFLTYLSSLRHDFVNLDDNLYVYENPHIRSFDAALFRWAFFDFHAANWHPLTWISHALDYAVWGLNPLGHHLTNNILHAINTFLVVVLVVKLIEIAKPITVYDLKSTPHHSPFTIHHSPFTLIAAVTTGLLFGLHPVHVESVAWVAERKDLLCALFFLLSILMYTRYTQSAKRIAQSEVQEGSTPGALRSAPFPLRYALFAFALALLSKPMAVTLPAVLLILDWYPFNRIRSLKLFLSAVFQKIPFIALTLISSMLTLLAQQAGGAVKSLEFAPFATRLLVAAVSLLAYLWKMMAPVNLVPYYPYPKGVTLFSIEYLSAITLVSGITALCVIMAAKQRKLLLSVWGYYVITLIPVIGIIQVGWQAMADRYTYLPSLGPFLLIGVVAAGVPAKLQSATAWGRASLIVTVAAAALLFVSLTYLTVDQIRIWKNSISLWSYVIEKQPIRVPLAYTNRGYAFMSSGQLDRAVADFDKAIALNPSDYRAHDNRRIAFEKMGRHDWAREEFDQGITYGEAGLFNDSIDRFNKSIAINPNYPLAYGNRGLLYSRIGEHARALKDLNTAVELDQNYAAAYGTRGNLYLTIGNNELAVADFQKACDLGDKKGCDALEAVERWLTNQRRQ